MFKNTFDGYQGHIVNCNNVEEVNRDWTFSHHYARFNAISKDVG